MISLAAVCALLFASPAASQAPTPYSQALAKARESYLTQQPGQPTLDAVAKLPAPPPELAAAAVSISFAVDAAKDVQLGCAAPCTGPADVQVYAGKVEMVARRLGMSDADVKAALEHYIPAGKARPRVPGATAGPADAAGRAAEAEVVARLLANDKLPAQLRGALNQKALAMAAALGRTSELKADPAGVVTLPDGARRRLTPEQLARLNAIPQNQALILRRLATAPPPSPTVPKSKQEQALAEADAEIKADPGRIGSAYSFWDREAKDPSSNWLWRGYADLNKGLLTFSGLKAVEESSARLGYVWDNADVSKGEKFWLETKLVGNSALTAVSFLPAASFAKSLQAGEGFYLVGKAGAVVPGMARAAPDVAAAMDSGGRTVTSAIVETLPQGTKAGTPELRALIVNMNSKLGPYGLKIVEGGTAGESVAKGGTIYVSLKAGAQHEMIHVVQQTYTRVLALEQVAARSGTTVEALSAAQRAEAMATAVKWETASYAQLESQAFRGTGVMGAGGGAGYANQMLLTGQEVSSGMRNGTVLNGAFGPGATVYGRLTQLLGHNQAQISTGIGSLFSGTLNTPLGDAAREMTDGYVRPLTAPPAAK
ncbi:MAG TPA: hypothetical protein VH309_05900 [Elusimicrobiota bacterium]|nr:hypothetical protein [Elusimicrobiota bacterium]